MERRITFFFLTFGILLLAWVLLGGCPGERGDRGAAAPAVDAAPAPGALAEVAQLDPPRREIFQMRFGRPGEAGAMAVTFDTRGGCVAEVRLMDHYARPGLSEEEKLDPAHWYPIIQPPAPVDPGRPPPPLSFRLEDDYRRFGTLRLEEVDWRPARHGDGRGVTFRLDADNGLSLEKVFRHQQGERRLDLSVRLIAREGAPREGRWLFLLMGPCHLPNPRQDWKFGNPSRVIGRTVDRATGESFSHFLQADSKENPAARPDVVVTRSPQFIDFVAAVNRFFAGVVLPATAEDAANLAFAKMEKLPYPRHVGLRDDTMPAYGAAVPLVYFYLDVPRGGGGQGQGGEAVSTLDLHVHLVPKDPRVLADGRLQEAMAVIRNIDLEPPCCSVPGAKPLGRALLWLLNVIHGVIPSWGIAVILLTCLIRGLLVPLNYKQQKSMRLYQDRMMKLKPRIDAIKEKHKNNPQKLNQELMAFNKEHKLFPPLMGCLPMLVTLPVFIGLFTALRVAFELRHQAFLFVPDLSEPDRLIPLSFTLPVVGYPVEGINVLPFLMIAMWILLYSTMPQATDPQQRQIQKMMRWMPVVFGVILYNYASALMLYMICSSLFGMAEQRVLRARLGKLAPTPIAPM